MERPDKSIARNAQDSRWIEWVRQPEAAIFSRAALDRKPDRVKPLSLAAASIASSKKGVSAHQLMRLRRLFAWIDSL